MSGSSARAGGTPANGTERLQPPRSCAVPPSTEAWRPACRLKSGTISCLRSATDPPTSRSRSKRHQHRFLSAPFLQRSPNSVHALSPARLRSPSRSLGTGSTRIRCTRRGTLGPGHPRTRPRGHVGTRAPCPPSARAEWRAPCEPRLHAVTARGSTIQPPNRHHHEPGSKPISPAIAGGLQPARKGLRQGQSWSEHREPSNETHRERNPECRLGSGPGRTGTTGALPGPRACPEQPAADRRLGQHGRRHRQRQAHRSRSRPPSRPRSMPWA